MFEQEKLIWQKQIDEQNGIIELLNNSIKDLSAKNKELIIAHKSKNKCYEIV